jgi:uncharacterized membrane protein YgcG
MRRLGLMFAATISMITVCPPATAATISWLPGTNVYACSSVSGARAQSCVPIRTNDTAEPLLNVLPGGFLTVYDASWIEETGKGYRLCVLNRGNAACERLSMPHLGNAKLAMTTDLSGIGQLTIGFFTPEDTRSADKMARKAIGRAFLDAYMEARDRLIKSQSFFTIPTKVAGTILIDTQGLVDGEGCEVESLCGTIGGGSGGGGGGGGGGGSFGGTPDGPGAANPTWFPWGLGAFAMNPVCAARCTGIYDAAAVYCRMVPLPQGRAICWAAAATQYGACLALC